MNASTRFFFVRRSTTPTRLRPHCPKRSLYRTLSLPRIWNGRPLPLPPPLGYGLEGIPSQQPALIFLDPPTTARGRAGRALPTPLPAAGMHSPCTLALAGRARWAAGPRWPPLARQHAGRGEGRPGPAAAWMVATPAAGGAQVRGSALFVCFPLLTRSRPVEVLPSACVRRGVMEGAAFAVSERERDRRRGDHPTLFAFGRAQKRGHEGWMDEGPPSLPRTHKRRVQEEESTRCCVCLGLGREFARPFFLACPWGLLAAPVTSKKASSFYEKRARASPFLPCPALSRTADRLPSPQPSRIRGPSW